MSHGFAAAIVVGACCASLWGCGSQVSLSDDPPDDDPPGLLDIGVTPGSRLRPVVATAEGVAAFMNWHDTELQVDCEFRTATDGTLRCFPQGASVVFLDEACTVPAFLERPCGVPYTHGSTFVTPGPPCAPSSVGGLGHAAYERSQGEADADTYYVPQARPNEVDCTSRTLDPGETLVPAAVLADELLVAAEEQLVHGEERLSRVEVRATDGAVERIAGFDTELETRCIGGPFVRKADYPLVDEACLPRSVDGIRHDRFADATCREPVARRHGCPSTALAGQTACEPRRYYGVGEPLDTVYGNETNICVAIVPEEDHVSVGPELLPGDGLAAIDVQALGGGRLRMETRTDERGWPLDKATLFDSVTGYRCSIWRHGPLDEPGSDVAQCLPPMGVSISLSYHTAADCTSEALFPFAVCPPYEWLGFHEPTDDGCSRTLGYREVLEPLDHDGPLYQKPAGGGSCTLNGSTGPVSRLGELLAPDSFTTVSVEIW